MVVGKAFWKHALKSFFEKWSYLQFGKHVALNGGWLSQDHVRGEVVNSVFFTIFVHIGQKQKSV